VATLLACGCTVVTPKSRFEPHERVAIELRGALALELDLPEGMPDAPALEARFADSVIRELSRRRSIAQDSSRADAVLAIRLSRVELQSLPGDQLALRITAAARVETGGEDPGKARGPWHASEYESPAQARADWSGANAPTLEAALTTGLNAIADEIVSRSIRARQPE
jgi:hypothetical protein